MQQVSTVIGNEVGDRRPDLRMPEGLAIGTDGSLYVADVDNHHIGRLKDGEFETFAGLAGLLFRDGNGYPSGGFADGNRDTAMFRSPSAIAAGPDGSLYVADSDNHSIRRIYPTGKVATLAGNGVIGSKDGMGEAASFQHPEGIAVSGDGTVYVADTLNHAIRRIKPDGTTTTLNAISSRVVEVYPGVVKKAGDYRDGDLSFALFNEPSGIAIDAKGNLFVSDTGNHRIRYIDLTLGTVVTVAGTSPKYKEDALYAQGGYKDGTSSQALFGSPQGIALDAKGGLVIADSMNHAIRYLRGGIVSTLAGNGVQGVSGMRDGTETSALFDTPQGVAIASDGTIYVADSGNDAIRRIVPYSLPAGISYGDEIRVVLGQTVVSFDAKPRLVDARVMVPVRQIAEALGYKVEFSEDGSKVLLSDDKVTIELNIGRKDIRRSEEGRADFVKDMDVSPFISKNRTFVPLRFFAEEIGLDVQWLGTQQAAILRVR
ncbi:stalk domain-containing protein [Cohnella sp. GCM10027633]|uniref:stalk domain-containing protein n=1 Tax=unclassified Cohnella TaxID=2636738 RepID=UPI00362A2C4E